MRTNRTKFFAIILFALPLLMLAVFNVQPAKVLAALPDDAATTYKAKCAMCHTPTASKFYDPARPEAEQIDAILKGKKGEKPPYMPGFEVKGMTADEAKGLVDLMKTLKPAS